MDETLAGCASNSICLRENGLFSNGGIVFSPSTLHPIHRHGTKMDRGGVFFIFTFKNRKPSKAALPVVPQRSCCAFENLNSTVEEHTARNGATPPICPDSQAYACESVLEEMEIFTLH